MLQEAESQTAADQPQQATSIFDELEAQESQSAEGEEPGASAAEGELGQEDLAGGAQTREEEADWLPTEQDKVFPDEVYQRYAQRYPKIAKMLEEDPTNEDLRRLLHDKINTDIFLKQQQQAQTTPEEQQAEAVRQQLTPEQANAAWQSNYLQQLDTDTEQILDPHMTDRFGQELVAAMGVDPNAQDTMSQNLIANAPAIVRTLAKMGVNLFQSLFANSDIANWAVGRGMQQYEGFQDFWLDTSRQKAWEAVCNSNPEYRNLPAYGTQEWLQAIQQVAAMVPGFEEAVFVDASGRRLSTMQNFVRKSQIAASLLAGQRVEPDEIKRAVDKGRELEKHAARSRINGQLGAGQSTRNAPRVTGNEDLFGSPGEVRVSHRIG